MTIRQTEEYSRNTVWGRTGTAVGRHLRPLVGDEVQRQLHDQLWDPVWNQINGIVWAQVEEQVRSTYDD
jgi:hypothetical protein